MTVIYKLFAMEQGNPTQVESTFPQRRQLALQQRWPTDTGKKLN